MSPKKIRGALDVYVRVSRVGGREGESFISPEEQERKCRALAEARGLTIGEVFADLDVSGGKMDRPEFNKALERIKAGVSSGIVVARLDRFSRKLVDGLRTLEEIEQLGGVVLTADGDYDSSTATGELVLRLMLSLADFELRRFREGWADARRKMVMERGIHGGSKVPLGYAAKLDERGKRIGFELDPETAPIVREAFLARARGESWKAIFDALEAQPATQGRLGSLQSVRLMIRNRVYTGEARSGANVLGGAHPAIVSEGEWQAAQSQPARQALRTSHEGYLLSGLLRCDSCGLAMTADYATWRRKDGSLSKKPIYKCKAGRCKARAAISRTKIEDHVETVVLHTLMTKGERATAFETPDTAELRAAIEAATADEALWRERAVAGESPEIVMPAFEASKARRVEAERNLAEAEIAGSPSPEQRERAALWQAGDPETIERLWHSLSIPNRRELVATIWPSIYIMRGTGEVHKRISRRTTM